MPSEPTGDDEGQTTPTQQQQDQDHLVQGRVPSLPATMAPAANSAVAGRRASSPLSRPKSPTNRPFLPSSSLPSGLATASHNSKSASRFSDAFASLGGRTRTLSTASNSKSPHLAKDMALEVSAGVSLGDSSFGIDADPFASHYSASVTHNSHSAADVSSPPTSFHADAASNRKQRGSLLFAASDALGFGRVGASLSRRMGKRNSGEQTPPQQPQAHLQHRMGLPWKGKAKSKGQWALQPASSTHIISDVIEISAANAGSTSIRDEEEENERRERERLREAAAESIGISPLFREDASSRLTGNDSMRFEDDSFDDDGSREYNRNSLEDDPAERMRNLDRSHTSVNGSTKPSGAPGGLQQLQLQTKESRHQRSSSLSGVVTPTTPSSSNWPLPPLGGPPVLSSISNGRALATPSPVMAAQKQLPTFPSLLSSLDPFARKASTLLKHLPTSSLLILGFSRQWRSRHIVMTSPPQPRSPSLNTFRPYISSERLPSVYHLHVFKSSASDERELERLEVNENSVIFVAEEEIAGKRSVVKVGGMDVGRKKKELNTEENGQTMWFLSIADSNEAQNWIGILKSAVLDQRAERAGFGMPTYSTTASGPKGDLDVMLSLRAQDIASTIRSQTPVDLRSPAQQSDQGRAASPTPTVRSWSGDGRPSSPSGRMVSLKGLFSVPSRTRSLSHGTARIDEPPMTPVETSSFTSRGSTLLNMIRPSTGNGMSLGTLSDSKSVPSSPLATTRILPPPVLPTAPILSTIDMNLDRASLKERDRELPEWYSIQNRPHNRVDPTNASSALLPPPRTRRAWTSAGIVNNTTQDQSEDSTFPPRRSFQDTVSLVGGRLSVEETRRSHSPIDSIGTATGAFGTPELGSKRTSLSSSVSSFVSPQADRDQLMGRTNSAAQRRARMGKLPKMLTPPAGPPPSVPAKQAQTVPSTASNSADSNTLSTLGDRPPSQSSSIRSTPNSDVMQNGTMRIGRRLSDSSAFSAGSTGTSASRINNFNTMRHTPSPSISAKRASVPPPPRPAPTFALPPTPAQSPNLKQSGSSHRRTSFRDSFSHRSLRFSLTPPPTKGLPPRPDEATLRRRSLGGAISTSKHASSTPSIIVAPPVPPPTGPLPPTPLDLHTPNRYSFRERLRMKSAPSTPPLGMLRGAAGPPTSFPGSPPLVTVSSVASLKDAPHSPPIGEPITAIPKDLNFLSMSPTEASAPSVDDTNFLSMSPALTGSFPMQIHTRNSEPPPPEHLNGSPPSTEMTVLPPPPRRSRNGTFSEKDRDRSSQSLSSTVSPAVVENYIPHPDCALGTVATV